MLGAAYFSLSPKQSTLGGVKFTKKPLKFD
jgi:hypothetical protein